MPKLKIDNMDVEVAPGTSILQAAEQLGIEVPRFCYHDRLSVPANCRMCLVEVEGGPPKPVASCAMACADDMVVHTDSPMVKKARKGVMEFLLINHPLDCPICDQGGECDLQDQAAGYGYDRSRYHENKRAVPNKDIGPLVKTIMTRCIQCTRCVRFTDEIAGMTELGLLHRGEDVEIDTFVQKAMKSELSGNLIDICPVGALTSAPYAFKARSWELAKTETIDVHDAVGCNIRVDSRGGEVMRVLPRLHEDINEEWINDRTRFAYDGLKRNRLDRPWMRDETGKLRPASWDEALAAVAEQLKKTKKDKVAALAGDLCDLESMVALKDLLETENLECRIDGAQFDPGERCGYIFNSGIAGIEQADAILLVGTNPRWEGSLVNARIRKKWLADKVHIGVIGEAVDLGYPYMHVGATPEDFAAMVKEYAGKVKAERPMIIAGMGAFQRGDGEAVHAMLYDAAQELGCIKDDWNGFNVLHTAASRVGALDIGFYSKGGFDLSKMDFVYLLGADDLNMDQIGKKAFVVYQGHHGDIGAHRADVILPGAAYTEKDALYVNTEGRVQQARRAVYPPGEAREDWKILRALSGYQAKPLPYDNILQLRERIVKEWKHLGTLDVLQPAAWKKFGKKGKLLKQNFELPIENFYLTNCITRSSDTMMECTEAFLRAEDVAEAAE
ncbi:MAG: NADH-quinone oxidoreductase subunit G [Rhodospirillales bacterium]|nr:NADH-quinone oxidoreductase subunit G [Rhodospirillales bacterium]MCB9995588.1 NADH-quinone oxidoreductase subunit G [Rhodospirillales bacterium]